MLPAPEQNQPRSVLGLRQRLLLSILAPLTLIFVISVVFGYQLAEETANAAFDLALTDTALDIASHVESGEMLRVELSGEAEAMLRRDAADQIYFSVRDRYGALLAGDADLPVIARINAPYPVFEDRTFRDMATRAIAYRVQTSHGEVLITVAETLAKRQAASHRILAAMVGPTLAVILATFLTVYVGVHQGLRPLATIEREIAVRSPNDLRAITVEGTPREIQPMLTRLNRLFALLRQASAGQQRFLADAAHQLRTPLTGLQTQIELAAAEGRFDGDVERRQRFDEATRRIAHLIDQLLLFARAEAAGAAPLFEPVSLPTLLEQAASIFLDQALAREIDLGFEVAPATVVGIPSLLREALANLIDNALRYTPAQGVVTVRCGCRDQHAFLEVEDDGPGIPPAAREQVFERFTRLPAAPGNGCGLGLAIVREIAELHSATVELADPDGGRGLRIALLFPVQATATESAATRHDARDERR